MSVSLTHYRPGRQKWTTDKSHTRHPSMKAALAAATNGSVVFLLGDRKLREDCARHGHSTDVR